MLRLPKFELRRPTSVAEAVAQKAEYGERAQWIAGGTDLLPNMKHELFTPDVVLALGDIEELHGIRTLENGGLAIGAMTTLETVAESEPVLERATVLAQAAGVVAGPQLRTMGTLGGNVLLDTRCQWYNQTYFWRKALGFCLKKDGTLCHVVAGGKKCVAAASNDTAPALMALGATLVFASSSGTRELPVVELFKSDGIWNKRAEPDELLVEVRIPPVPETHRRLGAYGKLRDRESIDFPLLGIAARLDLDAGGKIVDASVVATALAAKPLVIKKSMELLDGLDPTSEAFSPAVLALGDAAFRQCHPLPNIPGDEDYRREMVPVVLKRVLHAAATGSGPVHPV